MVADSKTDVDDLDRMDVFMKDFPAGSGYQNLVFYSQAVDDAVNWHRYNFGHIGNMEKYHMAEPPVVPLADISIPTGLFIGIYDKLATVADNEWLVQQLNPEKLVWNKTYPLGHLSFSLAKDMSWFTEDVVNLVGQYATNSFAKEPSFLATNFS